MKIGIFDSGIGGITVLKEAVADRKPIIINKNPKKVAISPWKKVRIIKPTE